MIQMGQADLRHVGQAQSFDIELTVVGVSRAQSVEPRVMGVEK